LPFVELPHSPHAPGVRPVRIHYRDVGSGPPVVFLHGGWGYRVYPINHQIRAFRDRARFIIPDRSGYGRSTPLSGPMPVDFHQRAAEETILLLDVLGIRRAILWGHSDGAVIAAKIGLMAPRRCLRLILEAFHFDPRKPNSCGFFQQFARNPGDVKEDTVKLLAADHGAERWKNVVQRSCRVWLKLTAESERSGDDLYNGQLSKLKVPVTLMHGRCDPRTEPGEIERAQEATPAAEMRFIEAGRHSPHSERESWQECNRILAPFFPR
jgi:3-oxoadipate enol-lactonase